MKKHKKWLSRRKIVGLVATFAAFAGTAVFAAWMTDGTGDAGGQFSAAQPLTVTAVYSPDLAPGEDGTAGVRVTNPNDWTAHIETVQFSGPIVAVSGPPECASHVTLNSTAPFDVSGSDPYVESGASEDVLVPSVLHADNTTPTSCQGAKVSLTATVHAR